MEVSEKYPGLVPEDHVSAGGLNNEVARALLLDETDSDLTLKRGRSPAVAAGLVLASLGLAVASLTVLRIVHQENVKGTLATVEQALVLDQPWECHNYGVSQDNEWCQAAEARGPDGGFEYKFVGEAENLCGDCWCCRRPAAIAPKHGQQREPVCTPANKPCFETPCCESANLRCDEIIGLLESGWFCTDTVQASARKARADERARSEGLFDNPHAVAKPEAEWQCHRYSMAEDNDWCRTAGTIAGVEYRFVGAAANLCGDCWCCQNHLGCAKRGQDCRESKCCAQAGFQCFEENSSWAECKSTCTTHGWSCKELGERAPFTTDIATAGAALGQACAAVGKCKHEGYQCYQKDDYYSACQVSCDKGKGWSCKEHGKRTPMQSSKGETKCAWGKDLCSPSACCNGEGLQCYSRDEYWSSCLRSCNRTMDFGAGPEPWSCQEHGSRREVKLGCSWAQEECGATKKCCQPGFQCVAKDPHRAFCVEETLLHDHSSWAGDILGGAREEVEAKLKKPGKGKTGATLFCFTTVIAASPEETLRELAQDKKAGIFACDGHVWVRWKSEEQVAGRVTTDGLLFIWDELLFDGRYKTYDWTVKVEPDTVFFPDRLRAKLRTLPVAPKKEPIYVKNAMKDSGPSFEAANGYCRGGAEKWQSGDPFDCMGRQLKTSAECQQACEARQDCGAFDRDDKEGPTECCLFKGGFHGNNAPGRKCYVKKTGFAALDSTSQEPIMHSAIEVLSLAAVKKLANVFRECFGSVPHLKEDEQMRGCMTAVGAKFTLELDVLRTPDHNNPCTDPARVAFHPRSDKGSWEQCLNEAMPT